MKYIATGSRNGKRIVRLVIEAETEEDEAVLFQKLGDFKEGTGLLQLQEWYGDVLVLLQEEPLLVKAVAEKLGIEETTANNRCRHLFKMGLLSREAVPAPTGYGRSYLYSLNLRAADAPVPDEVW